jgi:hypothetical protein
MKMSRTYGSNHKWTAVIAGLLMAAGVLLLIFMITEEGEPGALPLIFIALGSGCFYQIRRLHRKPSV